MDIAALGKNRGIAFLGDDGLRTRRETSNFRTQLVLKDFRHGPRAFTRGPRCDPEGGVRRAFKSIAEKSGMFVNRPLGSACPRPCGTNGTHHATRQNARDLCFALCGRHAVRVLRVCHAAPLGFDRRSHRGIVSGALMQTPKHVRAATNRPARSERSDANLAVVTVGFAIALRARSPVNPRPFGRETWRNFGPSLPIGETLSSAGGT